jgi:hypothetical protein
MARHHKYYVRSNWAARALATLGLALLAAIAGVGCAGPNQAARSARRITYADLDGPGRRAAFETLAELPVIVRFRKGDRVPVDLQLDSSLLQLESPGLVLIAKRDFHLLLRADAGPLLSENGVDFQPAAKNYFGFGFEVQRDQPTRLRVRLGVRPEAAP